MQEFTLRNPFIILEDFFHILKIIENNKFIKIFIDQVMSWLNMLNIPNVCVYKRILFTVMLYFIKEGKKDDNDNLRRKIESIRKFIIPVFEFIAKRVKISSNFSLRRIKQIIYCLGLIVKIVHENKKK